MYIINGRRPERGEHKDALFTVCPSVSSVSLPSSPSVCVLHCPEVLQTDRRLLSPAGAVEGSRVIVNLYLENNSAPLILLATGCWSADSVGCFVCSVGVRQ